jgi:hypothetical protein
VLPLWEYKSLFVAASPWDSSSSEASVSALTPNTSGWLVPSPPPLSQEISMAMHSSSKYN